MSVLRWPDATARYSCFRVPVETGTPPRDRCSEGILYYIIESGRIVLRFDDRIGSDLLRFGVIHPKGLHGDFRHLAAAAGADSLVRRLHALGHLPERGIFPVQVGGGGHHNEELTSGGVGVHGPGHGQHAPLVGQVVCEAVGGELPLDAVARTAGTGALGVAALDHEAGDAAVEGQAVIKPLLNQGDEIVDGIRRFVRVELGLHHAAALHLNGNDGIVHSDQILSKIQKIEIQRLPVFHSPVHFPLGVPRGGGGPFVIELLSAGQAQLQLDSGAPEIDRQRDKGVAVLLDAAEQA